MVVGGAPGIGVCCRGDAKDLANSEADNCFFFLPTEVVNATGGFNPRTSHVKGEAMTMALPSLSDQALWA
jgi:hypothetical protein